MANPKLVVITPADNGAVRHLAPLRELADVTVSADADELVRLLPAAEIVVVGLDWQPLDLPELWQYAKSVRWVHSLSAGVEGLLFPALERSVVPLTNARGVFKRPLAEFTLMGMLFHYKRLRRLIENQRAHRWQDMNVWQPKDRVMGVVGYGGIGRECALLGHAVGMRIHALRRNPERSSEDRIVERIFRHDQLNELLSGIDVLVCAAPLTHATHHMIGEAQFAVMKPTALVVNVGRGPVIDETALVRALIDARIAGASLDVVEHEPLPYDSPLWEMENVLISPHCADRTVDPDWLQLTVQFFIENFRRYLSGAPLENLVDKRAGY